ncbi:helix-turn-helix transcriptional regulator [Proteus vulgaris]|uniref:helix-turn-helix transcriptional regulator n=1 Tax=Proteus vulgaris TaxID=585 RepID=UPI003F8A1CFA
MISVSQQQISRYENGKNSMSLSLINKLLIIFDKSWDDLNREVISNYNEKVTNTQLKKRDHEFSGNIISQLN